MPEVARDRQAAAAAATTEVKKGTNVASVAKSISTVNGHSISTVNADGASVSNTDGNLSIGSLCAIVATQAEA